MNLYTSCLSKHSHTCNDNLNFASHRHVTPRRTRTHALIYPTTTASRHRHCAAELQPCACGCAHRCSGLLDCSTHRPRGRMAARVIGPTDINWPVGMRARRSTYLMCLPLCEFVLTAVLFWGHCCIKASRYVIIHALISIRTPAQYSQRCHGRAAKERSRALTGEASSNNAVLPCTAVHCRAAVLLCCCAAVRMYERVGVIMCCCVAPPTVQVPPTSVRTSGKSGQQPCLYADMRSVVMTSSLLQARFRRR